MTLSRTPTVVNTLPFALDGPRTYTLLLTCAAAMSGTLRRSASKSLIGTATAAPVLVRRVGRAHLVAATASGNMTRATSRVLAVLVAPEAFRTAALARILPPGSAQGLGLGPRRLLGKTLLDDATAIPDTGLVLNKTLPSPVGAGGALALGLIRILAVIVGVAGSLLRRLTRTLIVPVTSAGAMLRRTSRTLTTSTDTSGNVSLFQQLSRTLSTAVTASTSLNANRLRTLALAAVIDATGLLTSGGATSLVLLATVTAGGVIARALSFHLNGSATTGPAVKRLTNVRMRATATAPGSLVPLAGKVLASVTAPVAFLTLGVVHLLAAAVTSVGASRRSISVTKTVDADSAGLLARRTERFILVIADVVAVASTLRSLATVLATTAGAVPTLARSLTKAVTAILAAVGGAIRSAMALLLTVAASQPASALTSFRTFATSPLAVGSAVLDRSLIRLALSASVDALPKLTKRTARALATAVMIAGNAARRAGRTLQGSAAASAAFTFIRGFTLQLIGYVTVVGSLSVKTILRNLALTFGDPLLKWTLYLLPARWETADPRLKWLARLIPARWRTGDPGSRWKEGE